MTPVAIHWDDGQCASSCFAVGAAWLGTELAARLPHAALDSEPPLLGAHQPPIVASREGLASVSEQTLRSSRLVVLLDPTDADRNRALAALAGRDDARVAIIPSPDTIAAAEHTLLLMLALSRHLFRSYSDLVSGVRETGVASRLTDAYSAAPNWVGMPAPESLAGKTLGIIGLGRVGEAVAARAAAFGMWLIYHDAEPRPAAELRYRAESRRFDRLLREADVVSLHLPLTPEATRLIDAPELALMKPTAYLINTAHGRLVDEGALIKALRAREIAGAGLDVFAYEALPQDSPLIALDNVVLTPHIGGVSPDDERRILACRAADELLRAGDRLIHSPRA